MKDDYTYYPIGATYDFRAGHGPANVAQKYHWLYGQYRIGHGECDFSAACKYINTFGMQEDLGMEFIDRPHSATVDSVLLMDFSLGPLRFYIPTRIVYVLDDQERTQPQTGTINPALRYIARGGFAYGTLTGHPESGEELFSVELREDDSVWAVVLSFSRSGRWFTAICAAPAYLLQKWALNKYLYNARKAMLKMHKAEKVNVEQKKLYRD